jgi:hypothetical protein
VVFGNAIPKNGSKLLFNILRGLTHIGPFVDTGLNAIKPYMAGEPTPQGWINRQLDALRPGDLRFGYLHATEANLSHVCQPGWAVFQILRDPRDSLVSAIFYARDIHLDHGLHEYYQSIEDMETRIQAAIHGIDEEGVHLTHIRGRYQRYLDWLKQPQVCVIRFEDLVSVPESQLHRVVDHLKAQGFQPRVERSKAVDILQRQMAPEKSETFRKGKPGAWREHFTERNKAEFKEVAGDMLIRLGYERDLSW